MRIVGGRAATLVLVAAMTLAGCSGGGTTDDTSGSTVSPREDTTDTTSVEEALGMLPPDLGYLDFRSDRHSAERLGLFDDGATSYAELGTGYADRVSDVPDTDLAAVSSLAGAVGLMAEGDAAFSQLDVRWSMSAFTGAGFADSEGRSVEVFRLVDGVDMEDVVADLEDAGFDRNSQADWEAFHLDGTLSDHVDVAEGGEIAGRYPRDFFPDVSVHARAHLVAIGDVSVLAPSGSSTTADLLLRVLPDDLAGLERVMLTPSRYLDCYRPVDKVTNNRATPEKIGAWAAKFGIEDLGVPSGSVLAWVPGEDLVHRSYFADAAAAQRALVARRRIYRAAERSEEPLGVLMPADGNESPYEPGWTMTRQAVAIEVLHNRTNPAGAVETYLQHGLGFDACGAPGMFS